MSPRSEPPSPPQLLPNPFRQKELHARLARQIALVREKLRLRSDDRVDFVFLSVREVAMWPRNLPFEETIGYLKSDLKIPASVEQMDDGIREGVRKRWERSM